MILVAQMLDLWILPTDSWCCVCFHLFTLCYSERILSIVLSLNSLTHLSSLSYYGANPVTFYHFWYFFFIYLHFIHPCSFSYAKSVCFLFISKVFAFSSWNVVISALKFLHNSDIWLNKKLALFSYFSFFFFTFKTCPISLFIYAK